MKKYTLVFFVVIMVFTLALTSLAAAKQPVSSITWNSVPDKIVAVHVDAVQNYTRKNASGPKITSNSHSADFPGLYFIWDPKQKDNGYLKVDAEVFNKYESFTLTAKESNTYWDFKISPQNNQLPTTDGCYVFFIQKAYKNKNINMVFIGDYVEKEEEDDDDDDDIVIIK